MTVSRNPNAFESRAGAWIAGGSGGSTMWPLTINLAGASVAQQFIVIESPKVTLGASAAPLIEQLEITHIEGTVGVQNHTNAAASANVVCGLFVADWNDVTGVYSNQDPKSAANASRSNWLWLKGQMLGFQTSGYPAVAPQFIIGGSPKLRLNPGQALMFNCNSDISTDLYLFLRLFISRVA